MRAVVRSVDRRGRISLPAEWRKEHRVSRRVLVRAKGDVLQIIPADCDLTAFFDAAEVDLKADLSDWHAVRRELQKW